jgi:hypothetical protein
MPTDLEQIATIKSQTLARLVEITAQPKPSYDIDGQKVDWATYLKQLQATVAWCEDQLSGAEPFEHATQAGT